MSAVEILVIIVSSAIVLGVVAKGIYNIVKKKPSCDCQACHDRMKRAIKKMKKDCHRKNDGV